MPSSATSAGRAAQAGARPAAGQRASRAAWPFPPDGPTVRRVAKFAVARPMTGRMHRSSAAPRRRLLPALAVALLAAVSLAAPAAAEELRAGCTPASGLFSGAEHPGACWRPFSPTSPYNQRLLPNDPRVVPNSSRIVDRLNGFGDPGTIEFGPREDGQGRGAKPLYFSRPTDPEFTIRLTQDVRNGGSWGQNPLNGMRIRIPDGAAPGPATDHHMVVIDQASGWSYDLWQVQGAARGGGTLTAAWGGRADLRGNGQVALPGTGSAARMGIAGGIVRPEELLDGDIPHALYLSARCTNGTSVFPSQQDGGENDCAGSGAGSNTDAPALGQRFQLGYTDAQIAALRVPAHDKVLLRAIAHYGFFLIDTTGEGWHFDTEASVDRTSLGLPDPGVAFAKAADLPYWAAGKRYIWHLDQIPGVDGKAGSWTKALRVVQPCVSQGTCPAGTPAPSGPDPLWPTTGGGTSSASPAATPTIAATATATATATVRISAPLPATATATATVKARAAVPVRSKPTAKQRAKARKAARAKARRVARIKARKTARARARQRALAQARQRIAERR